MKKYVLFIIGIFAIFIVANINAQSSSNSSMQEEYPNLDTTITVSKMGLHISFEPNYKDNPEENSVLVRVRKSKKFSKNDIFKGLKKFPLYHEEITLEYIQDCYNNNPMGDAVCILYNGAWVTIYCIAEDCKTFPGSHEYFPGKYIYIQYGLPESTNYILYDLANLMSPEGYVQPFELKIPSKILSLGN